jgi:uncharacterized membrane protein
MIKKNLKGNRKEFIKFIMFGIIIFSFIISVCDLIYLRLASSNIKEKTITSKELSFNGYEKIRNEYITTQSDPRIYLPTISMYVKSVSLKFTSSPEDISVQLFYTSKREGFSEQKSVRKSVSGSSVDFAVGKFVKKIRIDIAEMPGTVFSDFTIVINDPNIIRDKNIEDESKLLLFKQLVICLVLLIAAVSFMIIFLSKKFGIKFPYIIFLCGFLYMIVITPLSIPDPVYHFSRAAKVSNFLLFHLETLNVGDSTYTYIFDRASNGVFVSHRNVKSGYVELLDNLFRVESSELTPIPLHFNEKIYPIPYLPQALGLMLGHIIHINDLFEYYLGRLFALFFYTIVVGISVRIIPRFKTSLMTIALLPMALHQASSYSYDMFINAVSFLVISLIIKFAFSNEKIPIKDFIFLLALVIILTPVKWAYALLVFLVIMIPRTNFKNNKYFYLKTGLWIGIPFLLLVIFMVFFKPFTGNNYWEGVPYYTFDFALWYPITTVKIFMHTLIFNWYTYLAMLIGFSLSGLSLPISDFVINSYIILIIFTVFQEKNDTFVLELKSRLVVLSVFALILLSIMAALFFGWTRNNSGIILGVQGRYFIPIILLLLIGMRNRVIVYNYNIDRFIVFAAVLLNLNVVLQILNWTFINS